VGVDELLNLAPFDQAQKSIADAILAQFSSAGLGDIGLAAVANAWAESMLDPLVCYGRTPWGADRGFGPIPGMEDSCGLFQLNAASAAAGAGMSAADRMDATKNTARIIEVVKGPSGEPLRSAASSGATLATLIALFTIHIERPANAAEKGEERADDARGWGWPVDAPATSLSTRATRSGIFPLLIAGLLGVLVIYAVRQ